MSHINNLFYGFGSFQLDLNKRVLTCSGQTISLAPKAKEILIRLVANAGQLVEKDELLREIWPDTFVEEANLTQNIFTLRRALGDDRIDPRYIETVTRRGYRFIAAVNVVSTENLPTTTGGTTSEELVVAVLPFLNNTDNPELEYLAEGLTDNLINNFSRVSKLRVMSYSSISRYKAGAVDPQRAGKELGATAILIGRLNSRHPGIGISVELVDVSTGWQLWGDHFDLESRNLLQIQDAITRQLFGALKLELSVAEQGHITARDTDNAEAYKAYLEGRYHWSRYTKKGMEKAIGHFRRAIELDPNYALAYAAIVDCYLRLATNYFPPEEDRPKSVSQKLAGVNSDAFERVKLRFEWDWKSVKREHRRADELKTNYLSAHQWYFAYQLSKQLYRDLFSKQKSNKPLKPSGSKLVSQIPTLDLTPTEEIQILCSVARDRFAIGNYEAARLILRQWSTPGKWPRLHTLNPYAAADLLFTLGTLFAWLAASDQAGHGHKHAEIFLSGAIAFFEQLHAKSHSVEARVELARCFYRQGLFDIAHTTLAETASELPDDDLELRDSCLGLWGAVTSESGRFKDALNIMRPAINAAELQGDLDTVRCCQELALTLKDLSISEGIDSLADEAKVYFERALYMCEAVGNHRVAAAIENNLGFLLLNLRLFEESEMHLLHSKRLSLCLSDIVREAQVNETLSRLYIETKQYDLAQQVIDQAVETLERTDGEACLAEALRTAGVVATRQGRSADAKRNFEAAFKVAERCGDREGAGQALLMMFEEIGEHLVDSEKIQIAEKLKHSWTARSKPHYRYVSRSVSKKLPIRKPVTRIFDVESLSNPHDTRAFGEWRH